MARSATIYSPAAAEGVMLLKRVPRLISALAAAMGISRAAVYSWKVVPADRLLEVEKYTGIPRELLRPDLFPDAADRPTLPALYMQKQRADAYRDEAYSLRQEVKQLKETLAESRRKGRPRAAPQGKTA